LPPIEGLVSHRYVGSQLELVIANYADHHRELLESLEPTSIEVVELNLEDAFIEYTRGPKRSLPAFAETDPSRNPLGDKGAA
jgi:ABC-2 type transport system ATP-binding protein